MTLGNLGAWVLKGNADRVDLAALEVLRLLAVDQFTVLRSYWA